MAGIVDRMARMAELFLRMQRMHADPKMHPGARAYQTCNPGSPKAKEILKESKHSDQ